MVNWPFQSQKTTQREAHEDDNRKTRHTIPLDTVAATPSFVPIRLLFVGFPHRAHLPCTEIDPTRFHIARCSFDWARDFYKAVDAEYICLFSDSMDPNLVDRVRTISALIEGTPDRKLIAIGPHFPNEFKTFLMALGADHATRLRESPHAMLAVLADHIKADQLIPNI